MSYRQGVATRCKSLCLYRLERSPLFFADFSISRLVVIGLFPSFIFHYSIHLFKTFTNQNTYFFKCFPVLSKIFELPCVQLSTSLFEFYPKNILIRRINKKEELHLICSSSLEIIMSFDNNFVIFILYLQRSIRPLNSANNLS